MDSPLLVQSKQFALDIIRVCNKVKSEKRERVLRRRGRNTFCHSDSLIGSRGRDRTAAPNKDRPRHLRRGAEGQRKSRDGGMSVSAFFFF